MIRVSGLILIFACQVLIYPCFCDAIHDAAGRGDTDRITALLAEDPDAVHTRDGGGNTPLHLAAHGGHAEAAALLLNHGADVDAKDKRYGMTPLDLAFLRESQKGGTALVRLLHARSAAWDANQPMPFGRNRLFFAIVHGNTDMAAFLLEQGANPDTPDEAGKTPLCHAADRGRVEIAGLLMERGADVNHADREGNPPLRWAVEKGRTQLARALMDEGASPDFEDRATGMTLLHLAALEVRARLGART